MKGLFVYYWTLLLPIIVIYNVYLLEFLAILFCVHTDMYWMSTLCYIPKLCIKL